VLTSLHDTYDEPSSCHRKVKLLLFEDRTVQSLHCFVGFLDTGWGSTGIQAGLLWWSRVSKTYVCDPVTKRWRTGLAREGTEELF
jgi:hypothetical protein